MAAPLESVEDDWCLVGCVGAVEDAVGLVDGLCAEWESGCGASGGHELCVVELVGLEGLPGGECFVCLEYWSVGLDAHGVAPVLDLFECLCALLFVGVVDGDVGGVVDGVVFALGEEVEHPFCVFEGGFEFVGAEVALAEEGVDLCLELFGCSVEFLCGVAGFAGFDCLCDVYACVASEEVECPADVEVCGEFGDGECL